MKKLLAVLLLLHAGASLAAGVEVRNVRMWPAPDHTRVVFDISGPVEHSLFQLSNPERVVIDLRNAELSRPVPSPDDSDKLLARIRTAPRNEHDLRVVLDLRQPVHPKSFLLKPNSTYGNRLVIDLEQVGEEDERRAVKSRAGMADALRDVVIAIDAGHGGEDPGATGSHGTREKDVVLRIARELERLIERERGMHAVLVRRGDYYVGLRKRMEIAREKKADLFISIHADAFRDRRVHGTSVYVISRNGASSEAARWLAEQENAADLVGGVSLDDKDDLLASVLLDLSQTATLSASAEVAARVLDQLKELGKTHKERVQRAGFVVLKSPDIPSILVETAFITNPVEERKLRDAGHRHRIAAAILEGVREYFRKNAPPGTLLAAHEHVITRGETLSGIAHHYRVSMDSLRRANGLRSENINEGEVLRIPYPAGS